MLPRQNNCVYTRMYEYIQAQCHTIHTQFHFTFYTFVPIEKIEGENAFPQSI